jgi:hypothetical protein
MKPNVLLFSIAIAFLLNAQPQSPCSDQQYLKLKNKPIDSLSQKEYEYFMLKEKYCNEAAFPRKDASDSTQTGIIEIEVSDLGKYRGYAPDCHVFIDDIFYGKPPYSGKISLGIHTISLFSENNFLGAAKDDKKGISTAKIKVNVEKGNKTKLIFKYKCETGSNHSCDHDEWSFDCNTIKN